MEAAIENAANDIKQREVRKIQKQIEQTNHGNHGNPGIHYRKRSNQLQRMRSEELLDRQLDEGKSSPLIKRQASLDECCVRNHQRRREAVAERNATERELVKETLKRLVKDNQ